MNADGSDQRLIGDPAAFDWEPRLSPDGHEVVVVRIRPDSARNTIVIRDLASGRERPVTPNATDLEHPDWSRDGRFIVYNTLKSSDGRDLQQIERVPANDPTAKPRVLAGDLTHTAFKATYSPDGKRIAFGCDGNMCLANADGSQVVILGGYPGDTLNHFAWGLSPAAH